MRFLVIGDTHFGVKGGDLAMFNHQIAFFENFVIPLCHEQGIKTLIFTGDLFDNRKTVNVFIAERVQALFNQWCMEGLEILAIVGNHDIFHREKNFPNSPSTIFLPDNRLTIFTEFGSKYGIDFYPWINKNNYSDTMDRCQEASNKICVGHFEFNNFPLNSVVDASHGMDHKLFSHYDMVISGHYHTQSKKDNVQYVGTPYQLNWGDYNDQKCIWILDTEEKTLEPIENTTQLFIRIEYNEDSLPEDLSFVKSKWVRLFVKNRTDQKKYDKFVERLKEAGPADVKFIEDLVKHSQEYKIENVDISNAVTIIQKYIDQSEFNGLDKTKIFKKVEDYYRKACFK